MRSTHKKTLLFDAGAPDTCLCAHASDPPWACHSEAGGGPAIPSLLAAWAERVLTITPPPRLANPWQPGLCARSSRDSPNERDGHTGPLSTH